MNANLQFNNMKVCRKKETIHVVYSFVLFGVDIFTISEFYVFLYFCKFWILGHLQLHIKIMRFFKLEHPSDVRT